MVSGCGNCQSIQVFHLRTPQVNRTTAVRQLHDQLAAALRVVVRFPLTMYDSRAAAVRNREFLFYGYRTALETAIRM